MDILAIEGPSEEAALVVVFHDGNGVDEAIGDGVNEAIGDGVDEMIGDVNSEAGMKLGSVESPPTLDFDSEIV